MSFELIKVCESAFDFFIVLNIPNREIYPIENSCNTEVTLHIHYIFIFLFSIVKLLNLLKRKCLFLNILSFSVALLKRNYRGEDEAESIFLQHLLSRPGLITTLRKNNILKNRYNMFLTEYCKKYRKSLFLAKLVAHMP